MATKDPREPFTRITAQEAKEKVDSGAVQIIDVRTPGEYEFWCGATTDGRRHRDLGMRGRFVVTP